MHVETKFWLTTFVRLFREINVSLRKRSYRSLIMVLKNRITIQIILWHRTYPSPKHRHMHSERIPPPFSCKNSSRAMLENVTGAFRILPYFLWQGQLCFSRAFSICVVGSTARYLGWRRTLPCRQPSSGLKAEHKKQLN